MFSSFENYPADPIFSLYPRYQQDHRPQKVNLSIGLYYDAMGELPLLSSVREALWLIYDTPRPSSYLPMSGHADYCQAVQSLLFGPDHPMLVAGNLSTIQSLAGTGALRVGAEILKRRFPNSKVWVSEPTWENQVAIFKATGFDVHRYPYYDSRSHSVDFESLVACLKALAPQSIIVFHPCCHNPTGADLSPEQWDEITAIAKAGRLIPVFDFAYQGFGSGIDEDAYAIRAMANQKVPCLVANSFSKNFALYGERCGALTFVCATPEEASLAHAEMVHTIRASYSNPPAHGASIIAKVLLNPRLAANWRTDVEQMRLRVQSMRAGLVQSLARRNTGNQYQHLIQTRGMFGVTGLSAQQVKTLQDEFAIYLVDTGRLCFAGLNPGNIETVADALAHFSGYGNLADGAYFDE